MADTDDSKTNPTDDGGDSQGGEPKGGEPGGEPQGGDDVLDKHGHPGISEGKYNRDIKERDDKIAELEAKIAEASESKERADQLKAEFDAYKAEVTDKDTMYELALAGCIDVKAGKSRLGDFGGDVNKLKAECPYLFNDKKGSLGFPPGGAPTKTKAEIMGEKDRDKRLAAIAENMSLFE